MTANKLVLWYAGDFDRIADFMRPLLMEQKTPHVMAAHADGELPVCGVGSTILAMGGPVVNTLAEKGLVAKNRTVTSLRGGLTITGERRVFCTFDPAITFYDPTKATEIVWDFKLARRFLETGTTNPNVGAYRYVDDFTDALAFINDKYNKTKRRVPVSLDLETVGLDPYEPGKYIVSVSITHSAGMADVIRFEDAHDDRQPGYVEDFTPYLINEFLWHQMWELLNSPKIYLIGANLKYDLHWMGVHWGLGTADAFKLDTTIIGSCIDENRSNSLNNHAKIYTSMGGYDSAFNAKYDKSRMDLVPAEDLLPYAGGDTDACWQVAKAMHQEIRNDSRVHTFYTRLLHPAMTAFNVIEQQGWVINKDKLNILGGELDTILAGLLAELREFFPEHLKERHKKKAPLGDAIMLDYLFGKDGLNLKPVELTPTGLPTKKLTHIQTLAETNPELNEFVDKLKEYNSAHKTRSTYVTGFLKHLRSDGLFHPTYIFYKGDTGLDSEGGTNTGRLSAQNPPAQCMVGDTPVLTNEGYKRIDWLVANNGAGLQVLTHSGQYRDIIGVYENGTKPVRTITFANGSKITCTNNHPILTPSGWVDAQFLVKGDTGYARKSERKKTRVLSEREEDESLPNMGGHEVEVSGRKQQGLPALWRGWNNSCSPLGYLRKLFSGHGGATYTTAFYRSLPRLTGELRTPELSLGHAYPTTRQPKKYDFYNSQRPDQDTDRMGTPSEGVETDAILSVPQGVASHRDSRASKKAGFEQTEITSIEVEGMHQETFDLTIDRCHSFVANDIVVHNTVPKHTKWAKPLRRCYPPPKETGKKFVILKADYSQGELRIAACVAKCTPMIKGYKTGQDLHLIGGANAKGVSIKEALKYEKYVNEVINPKLAKDVDLTATEKERLDFYKTMRQGGKASNFGFLYGMGPTGFVTYAYDTFGVHYSIEEAEQARENFFHLYPQLLDWHRRQIAFAKKHGFVISPLGRKRHLPLINSPDNATSSKFGRNAINSPVQATLSDMGLLAISILHRKYPELRMWGMTHDDTGFYIPEDELVPWARRIRQVMENLPLRSWFGWKHQLPFPVDMELGTDNLGDLIDYREPAHDV